MEKEILLEGKGIHRSFQTGDERLNVLKGVDIEMSKGEMVAVVGESGVGKSTLLHILGALDRPDQGMVRLNSKDIFSLSDQKLANFRNESIGFVFQFHHLLPEFSALENVMMPGLIAGENENEVIDKAKKILDEVGLSDRANHRPGELSGGEQQRVAVARALINQPQLVIADEPSGNLDKKNKDELHELFLDLNKRKNQTFVIATHNLELAKMAHRIYRLKEGKAFSINL